MKVKIVNKSDLPLPSYKTQGASGVDLQANISEDITLKPSERKLIPTGLFIEIPKGYEAQVRARSGLAIKNGITLINSVGTIDSDYRGEICVPLVNLGTEDFIIEHGDRIAQMVFAKYESVEWELANNLDETKRGTGGFGSTGL